MQIFKNSHKIKLSKSDQTKLNELVKARTKAEKEGKMKETDDLYKQIADFELEVGIL